MTKEQFEALSVGDVVQSSLAAHAWFVVFSKNELLAIQCTGMKRQIVRLSNPEEWKLISKVLERDVECDTQI